MPKITIDEARCKGCGLCIAFCPKEHIVLKKSLNKKGVHPAQILDKKECIGCKFCAVICPDSCIEVYK